jgi:segregation and condensation protein B
MNLADIVGRMTAEPNATKAFEDALRIGEALLFASREPLAAEAIAAHLPGGVSVEEALEALVALYAPRGVNLVQVAGKWAFRTAADLGGLLVREQSEQKKLSRAALETLAVIAYHQPVTRADIEDIRGVSIAKGTLDLLLETGWVRMRGRRRTPGRPLTYGTTSDFLEHFSLAAIEDLPGLAELKGTGFFDRALPTGFSVPTPSDAADLRDDEDPLDDAAADGDDGAADAPVADGPRIDAAAA